MGFKVLSHDLTGYIQIFRFHDFYRLTSHYYAGVTGMDLEEGLDVFVPASVGDAEFGAIIKRCHDSTRFLDWQTLPMGAAAAEWERKWDNLYIAWEQKALQVVGCKSLKNLYSNASNARGLRTNEEYFFFNSRITKSGNFSSISDSKPEYQEFIIQEPAADEKIGEIARAALDALVRSH